MMKRKNLCDDLREQTSQEKEKHVLGPVTEESLVCSGGKDPPISHLSCLLFHLHSQLMALLPVSSRN